MAGTAADAFVAWVRTAIAPIAHDNGLTGTGPVFRRRGGEVWTVFGVQRRRLDPREASAASNRLVVDVRFQLAKQLPYALGECSTGPDVVIRLTYASGW